MFQVHLCLRELVLFYPLCLSNEWKLGLLCFKLWDMDSIHEAIDKLTIAIHKTTSLQTGKLSSMLQPQRGFRRHRGWCLDEHPKGQLVTKITINTYMGWMSAQLKLG